MYVCMHNGVVFTPPAEWGVLHSVCVAQDAFLATATLRVMTNYALCALSIASKQRRQEHKRTYRRESAERTSELPHPGGG